jgi:hypothetical protein
MSLMIWPSWPSAPPEAPDDLDVPATCLECGAAFDEREPCCRCHIPDDPPCTL